MSDTQHLTFQNTVRIEHGRYCADRRRKVNRVLAAYRGEDGQEYRKSFTSYREPVVPPSGTHDELNARKEQF